MAKHKQFEQMVADMQSPASVAVVEPPESPSEPREQAPGQTPEAVEPLAALAKIDAGAHVTDDWPWWSVQGGDLPRLDIRAPNKEAAESEWMRRMQTRRIKPEAKAV